MHKRFVLEKATYTQLKKDILIILKRAVCVISLVHDASDLSSLVYTDMAIYSCTLRHGEKVGCNVQVNIYPDACHKLACHIG